MAFRWDIVYLQVDEKIFSAPRQALIKHSSVFEDMYLVGDGGKGEGKSEGHPIVLEGYKAADFEALLAILYPTMDDVIAGKFPLTKEQWVGVLRLSRPWAMEKIFQLAVETLSSESFSLTPLEKVALGRDHKVASWLVEGLETLVSAFADLSLNDLEDGVGTSTAFRIAGIRLKTSLGAAVTSISIGEAQCAAFPLTALHCGICGKPVVTGDLGCHSCSKTLKYTQLGGIYVSPGATTSTVTNNCYVGGHSFHLPLQHINCTSCNLGALKSGITCPHCNGGLTPTSNILLALFPSSSTNSNHSVEALVRDVFKSEIEACGL